MSANISENWFTEICNGSAYSMKIKEKLHEEQTKLQHIEIYDTEKFGKLMVIDGFVMLTELDNFLYHEMMSHPILFTHPNPKNVVIIGGGDCGTLQEVLKHDAVESVIQVEIDARVTRLAQQYFPALCTANSDTRAQFVFADGIKWIADAKAGSIDTIIIDSTDPVGPATGLFNKNFYRDCLHALSDDGIIVHQSESPFFDKQLFAKIRQAMAAAGFSYVHSLLFPQPCYPSGWWSATMASRKTKLTEFRYADAENKTFSSHYYNVEIHQAALAVPEFMRTPLFSLPAA